MPDPNPPVPAEDNTSASTIQTSASPQAVGKATNGAPPPPPWVSAPTQEEAAPPQTSQTEEKETEVSSVLEQPSQEETSEVVSSASPPPSFSTSSVVAPPANGGQKASIFKNFIPIIGGLAFIGLLIFIVTKFVLPNFLKGPLESSEEKISKTKANLTYWGLWEPDSVMNQIIADYQQTHPNVSINYIKQSHKDYRERMQAALASGSGPDIFRFHNTWVPMLKNELEPAPSGTIDLNLFYPVATKDLSIGQQVYGVPLEFDGLALYYNPKILQQAGKSVPTTWEELQKTAAKLTVRDSLGGIQTAGVALGTTNNIDNFSDILGLMILQNGGTPAEASSQLVADAVQFYTIFTTRDKIWDETLPGSTYAFATEKAAMFFAPSWRAFEIKEINPELEFAVAPVPQLPGAQTAWASYWVEGVSKRSKNAKAAWEFLKYLSSEAVVTKLYTVESNLRVFGEPYGLKNLSSSLETDAYAGAFVKQGPYAKSWYLCSRTFDNGINDKIIKYYKDAVNNVLNGKDIESSLKTADSGVNQVLSQYGLGKAPAQQVVEPQVSSPSSTSSTPEPLGEI